MRARTKMLIGAVTTLALTLGPSVAASAWSYRLPIHPKWWTR